MAPGEASEQGEEHLTLVVVRVDPTAAVASRANVVDAVGDCDARFAAHASEATRE
jgi:hypothetical protein